MKNSRRAGYMLMEVLAVAFILAVILGIAAQILLTCTRLSSFGTHTADRMAQAAEVEDAFRGAVREASEVLPGVGGYQTDADTLVLATPGEEGRRYIVLERSEEASRMTVLRFAEREGVLESDYADTLALPIQRLEFRHDAAEPRRVTMILEARPLGKISKVRETSAALGAIAPQEVYHE